MLTKLSLKNNQQISTRLFISFRNI